MNKRAVVTGGAGFLGSHLCERLLGRGYSVICMDNFLTGGPHNIAHLLGRRDFQVIECDLTSFVYVPGEVDLVLHFASAASPVDYLKLPVETLKVGSLGTLHALGLARLKNARFVLASTSEVYGDPLRPVDDPEVRRPDTTLARESLGWQPRISAADGLARTVRWFEEQTALLDEPEITVPAAASNGLFSPAPVGTGLSTGRSDR
jgi:nucleoside-diphosphate-sugar epimerase